MVLEDSVTIVTSSRYMELRLRSLGADDYPAGLSGLSSLLST